jgi:hypothetical protein
MLVQESDLETRIPITVRAIARGSRNHNNSEPAMVLLRFLLEPLRLTRGRKTRSRKIWPFGHGSNVEKLETNVYVAGRPGGLTGAGQQSTGQTSWLAGN